MDGKSELIPMSTSMGTFWLKQDPNQKNDIDQVGIGTVMYFKLLKFIIGFFVFACILESYLMYQYSDGKLDSGLNSISLGNLAFNYEQCKFSDVKLSNSIFLSCKSGSVIETLKEFALQAADAAQNDNICPVVGDEVTPILLGKLEPGCKYPYTDEPDFKTKITEKFDRDCKGKANCTITLEKSDWPAAC